MANILMPGQTSPGDTPSPNFNRLKPVIRSSSRMTFSPFTFKQQVFVWGPKIKVVDFSLPPLTETQASAWIGFLDSLNGFENTFTANLTLPYPQEPTATAVVMRLLNQDISWDLDTAKTFGVSWSAMEVK